MTTLLIVIAVIAYLVIGIVVDLLANNRESDPQAHGAAVLAWPFMAVVFIGGAIGLLGLSLIGCAAMWLEQKIKRWRK